MAIVRCWNDDDGPKGFRAHVTLVHDVDTPETSEESYAVNADGVLLRIRELLDEFGGRPAGSSRNDVTPA